MRTVRLEHVENQTFYDKPKAYCPICNNRVYANYVDNERGIKQ